MFHLCIRSPDAELCKDISSNVSEREREIFTQWQLEKWELSWAW